MEDDLVYYYNEDSNKWRFDDTLTQTWDSMNGGLHNHADFNLEKLLTTGVVFEIF